MASQSGRIRQGSRFGVGRIEPEPALLFAMQPGGGEQIEVEALLGRGLVDAKTRLVGGAEHGGDEPLATEVGTRRGGVAVEQLVVEARRLRIMPSGPVGEQPLQLAAVLDGLLDAIAEPAQLLRRGDEAADGLIGLLLGMAEPGAVLARGNRVLMQGGLLFGQVAQGHPFIDGLVQSLCEEAEGEHTAGRSRHSTRGGLAGRHGHWGRLVLAGQIEPERQLLPAGWSRRPALGRRELRAEDAQVAGVDGDASGDLGA